MKFSDYLKNLFTSSRPYSFVNSNSSKKPSKKIFPSSQQQNIISIRKTSLKQKKFMSKHRYTHTTRMWNVGNK